VHVSVRISHPREGDRRSDPKGSDPHSMCGEPGNLGYWQAILNSSLCAGHTSESDRPTVGVPGKDGDRWLASTDVQKHKTNFPLHQKSKETTRPSLFASSTQSGMIVMELEAEVVEMKEHWVFIDGRQGGPMICSRAGIRICYMDHKDKGPNLASRIPGLLVLYDEEKRRFKILRLNDRTGIELEGSSVSQRTIAEMEKEDGDVGEERR